MKNRGKMLQRSNRIEKFVDDVKILQDWMILESI